MEVHSEHPLASAVMEYALLSLGYSPKSAQGTFGDDLDASLGKVSTPSGLQRGRGVAGARRTDWVRPVRTNSTDTIQSPAGHISYPTY